MFQGSVVSINVAGTQEAPMQSLPQVQALAGRGLEGDRYCDTKPDGQVTLIAAEAIDAMEREEGYQLAYGDARRNIVTRDVPVGDLVGREFTVGGVSLRGIRLSEACTHLASLTDDRVLRGLAHRAGLKAEILTDGVIRVGDAVTDA